MATSLQALQQTTAETTVDVFGEQITITYLPGYITGDVDTRFRQAVQRATGAALGLDSLAPGPERQAAEADAQGAEDAMYELVSGLLVSWDVYVDPDHQQRLGTDVDSLRTLPATVVTRIYQQVREELGGKGQTVRRSVAGSSPPAPGSLLTADGTSRLTG